MQNNWVIDYETLKNCIVLCAEHYKTDLRKSFVIHESKNQLVELLEFLDDCKKEGSWHIGFNSLSFDSQITEYIMKERRVLKGLPDDEVARKIYKKVQEIITRSNNREWAEWAEWKLSIKTLDIFKTNHWDNPQRSASLKWVQYGMDWHNLQEMPIHHTEEIVAKQIPQIVEYCFNDVSSTKNVLNLSKAALGLRTEIFNTYKVNCFSYSNTKMGSELLLKLYCEYTGNKPYEVKQLRTQRNGIHVDEILFPYIKFKTRELRDFLELLRSKVIFNTKKDFKHSVTIDEVQFDYGAGGIHQCIKKGIYKSDENFMIIDFDVASLYPSIAIVNKMFPAHLGPEFYQVYKEGIVEVRLAEKAKGKDGNRAIVEGFKEAANASYGNSNSIHSWLFDPQYTMQTTINGQLMITMLCENLLINIPGAQLLQTNTDGATFRIPRHALDMYKACCKLWEKVTKLQLEFVEYRSMFIWDVNNYIGLYMDGKTKCKGRFEWEDYMKYKPSHLSKNKSYLVVAKGIYEYFVNGIKPEDYLKTNTNIFDYCAGSRVDSSWNFWEMCVTENDLTEVKLQKTIRFYITDKGGCKIVKKHKTDGRQIQVQAGRWMQMLYNQHRELPWEDRHVNMEFYRREIQKEIDSIEGKAKLQTDLFITNE